MEGKLVPSNDALTAEYLGIIQSLDGDVPSRQATYDYMRHSTAIVHHEVVASSFLPRLYNQDTYEKMKWASEMSHGILCKVIERYIEDSEYRKLFHFDERLEELILLPRNYDSLIPFARVDTFLDEEHYTIKFCEFNGDGSAGMNENREITNSILDSSSFKRFASEHSIKGCDLFMPWVKKFIEIYSTYKFKVDHPRFAICDYLENGVVDEFHIYAGLFEEQGYPCTVCDVRELTFDGDVLLDAQGNRIDAIWRRCVTNDVIEFWDESQALIEAVRAEKVALIGSFAGHVIHDKQIFEVLFKQETLDMMEPQEVSFIEQTIPRTAFLKSDDVNIPQIVANKDEWIIKPADHYGADNVYAGCEVSQGEWESLIERFKDDGAGYTFIVQRYMRPYKTQTLGPVSRIEAEILDGTATNPPVYQYNNLNGLYLFDGKFQGVFSRLGPNPTISKQNGGMTAATIWVDADVENGLELL